MKTLQRLLLVGALAISGVVATQTTALSQDEYTYTCIFVNGCKVLITYDKCGNKVSEEVDCGSTGSGVFSSPTPIERGVEAGSLNETLTPVSISTSVNDPTVGVVKTELDKDRTAPATTIVSAKEGELFPAIATIQFYATATIEANGDAKYASRDPLVFTAEVNSVAPFDNETFSLANDVDFYEIGDEAKNTAFRLRAGETNVTLGSEEGEQNDNLR